MTFLIRRAEPGDYLAIHEIHSQPEAIRGTLQVPFPSAETWKKRLAEAPDSLYLLLACAETQPVGCVGLHLEAHSARRRHAAHVGLTVHDRWQGQGAGTELMKAAIDLADNWLNLSRLELNVFTDNERAIGLYEKFGFEREGTLRRYAFREGRYIDAHCMARLRTDRESS